MDNVLFLSGQIGTMGLNAEDISQIRLVESGVQAETRQTMENTCASALPRRSRVTRK